MSTTLADRMKLRAAALGPALSDFKKARQTHQDNLRAIMGDGTRTQQWKESARANVMGTWQKDSESLRRALDREVLLFEAEDSRLRNPVVLLASERAAGTSSLVDDAAAKGEFRALMQSLPASERREWFSLLAESGDLGRIGVLVAMEPSLRENALGLAIPGRDEALKIAGQIRADLKEYRTQERDSRVAELHASPNLSEAQKLELMRISDEVARDQSGVGPRAVPLSEEERARCVELGRKGQSGHLSKAEARELMRLGDRLDIEQRSNFHPSPQVATDEDRMRFAILLNKTSLNGTERHEVIRLGALIQATDGPK